MPNNIAMYKLFFKLHLYASIIVCPFVLVFAITGTLMAFEPEIDHFLHAKLCYVEPSGKVLSFASIANKIHKAFPRDTIMGYDLSTSPDISYHVYTNSQTIYFDQYSGAILGVMHGPDFWQSTQNNIHQLHLRLALNNRKDIGKSIMNWTGVILLIILPAGLVLWRKQKRMAIRWKEKPRLVWFDWHSLIGVTAFIFITILAFTGVMIGFENQTTPMFYKLTGSKPTSQPDIKITAPVNWKQLSPDSALQIARAALPGASPFDINVPGITEAYDIRCRYPEDRTPGGRSRVMIDSYSGKVLYAEGSRTAPAGTRLKVINRAIHTGDIFGIFSKIIMSLASITLGFQLISGLRMYWLRKWKRKEKVKHA
jgi:uncharacterized iron-regulated membrane protein